MDWMNSMSFHELGSGEYATARKKKYSLSWSACLPKPSLYIGFLSIFFIELVQEKR
jgi:hypothetical protein